MADYPLLYATNRGHSGANRWKPTGYDGAFSADGRENLRFGEVIVSADAATVRKHLAASVKKLGTGDGEALGDYLGKQPQRIQAFNESPDGKQLGSVETFTRLRAVMEAGSDVVVFIHGYNVSWKEAVGTALSLQLMLNRGNPKRPVQVVLFSWPSDGKMIPWASYRSDRTDAEASGYAIGRGFLKLRDHLVQLGIANQRPCGGTIHLLAHSMGNFVLANALKRLAEFTTGGVMPRLFGHLFLCAADVDDDALEPGEPLARIDEVGEGIHVYHNTGDLALKTSDWTKGNPDRLGSAGPANPAKIHRKVDSIDCSALVGGIVEHSYAWMGIINGDIAQTIGGMASDDGKRRRQAIGERRWRMG